MIYRKKTANLNNSEKIADIQFILNHIFNSVETNLFSKDEIEVFNKSDYDEESSNDEDDD